MSESEHREEPEEQPTSAASDDEVRDHLVGKYTEVDGEGPEVRRVAGEYTRTERTTDEEAGVGDYVSTEENPQLHDPSERPGKYTRADHGEHHDG
ncbi:hypothetical protein [Microbacterium mangrovi]|nr:hypothetical protein [Microbacterium mangrovi]